MESDPSRAAADSTDIAAPGSSRAVAATPEPVPTFRLYKSSGVAMATFLGSPFAGLVVMAINYRRLSNPRAAWLALAAGVAFIAALAATTVLIPRDPPPAVGFGIAIGGLVAMRAIADSLQGRAVKAHARRGGPIASLWRAAGVALLAMAAGAVLLLALAFAALSLVGSDFDHKIDYTRTEEIYYAKAATPADARKLGDVLRDAGYFGGDAAKTVVLRTDSSGTAVSIVLARSWDDPRIVAAYQILGHKIAAAGFRGPITINLCNPDMDVKRAIPAQ